MQTEFTTLLFVRHAETRWNHEQRYAGSSEVALSPEAEQQIGLLTRSLIREKIDAIYSSPLTRCLATIEPTAEILGLPIHIAIELKERFLGTWEGKTAAELTPNHPGYHFPDSAYNNEFIIPEAETLDAVEGRLRAFLDLTLPLHLGQHLLVSTHAGIIWVLLQRVISNPPAEITWPKNGILLHLRYSQQGLELLT